MNHSDGFTRLSPSFTHLGSLPGTDPVQACAVVAGELGECPTIPELPERGPGADMLGRALALSSLVSADFSAETTPTGWRLAGHHRQTRTPAMSAGVSWLQRDWEAVAGEWASHSGTLRATMAGAWTLAAHVELPNGEPILSDPGATAELVAVMRVAGAELARRIRRDAPVVQLQMQVDEPSVPAVLAGRVSTQSGRSVVAPVAARTVESAWAADVAFFADEHVDLALHCCGGHVPLASAAQAGFRAISWDGTIGRTWDQEAAIGALWEAGTQVILGIDVTSADRSTRQRLDPVRRLEAVVGQTDLGGQLVLSPTCGLAGLNGWESVQEAFGRLAATASAYAEGAIHGSSEPDVRERRAATRKQGHS